MSLIFEILYTGLVVQCVSVGVGVTQLKKEDTVLNISKHLTASSLKDLKIRQPRQADAGGHSDPLDWLRASVPGEPGQDYPVLSAIQVRNNTIDDICPKASILYLHISSLLCRRLTFPALTELLEVTTPIQTSGAKLIMSVSRSDLSYFFSIHACIMYIVHCTRLSLLNLIIWLMAEMRILEITQNNLSQGTDSALYPVSFLCPNGTVFNQAVFVCDWW